MTFSEYISTMALKDYLAYCRKNKIKPELDIKVEPKKLCALVKPNP